MLLRPFSYPCHSVISTYLRESFALQPALYSSKQFIRKYAILPFFFIVIALYYSPAHSQENTLQISVVKTKVANLSAAEILTEAKFFKSSDPIISAELAKEILRISKGNKNNSESAQAHSLLGELAQQSKNIEQSLDHYLQASRIYKKMDDMHNQIISTIEYANIFFAEKRFKEGDKIIAELLPVAQKHGDKLLIAQTLIAKGDSSYRQKNYNDAIAQFTYAITYLSGQEQTIQKQLAETYKKIARSYKRLPNREQTAYFYKKTLRIYTALQDRKLMARTLNTLAEAERYLGNYVIALDYSTRGLEIQKQIDDPTGLAKALTGVGIIYRHIGRYEKSLKHILEAHQYYKKMNDARGIGDTSNQMGLIYSRLKQFDQARSFYQLTISLPEKKLKSQTLATALREMAVIDLNDGNYESAKVTALQAHQIYQSENDKLKASITARIIGNIYRDQKNDTQAIAYYRESLSLAIEKGSEIYQIKSQTPLASMLIGTNTDEAVNLLKKSLELSTKINNKSEQLYAYRTIRYAEKSRSNIAESLRYAEEEIKLTAIIQNEKDNEKIVLAKANLHSYKMEMELESLREKTKLDQLELAKKNSEIEIAEQASQISELELTKNKYASIALASLLVICLLAVIFIYRRFVDSKKRNRELDYLAARDPLTNCFNRRILFDLMNRDFTNSEAPNEYCIIMVDIDHFKDVNDTYGHNTGDSVLRSVASILQGSVRQNDIAARFGGEEFCIVLPGASQNKAMHIAETMRKKVEASHFDAINVTCSFGVSSIEFNAKTPSELIDQADLALFKSKSLGRNQVTLWDQTLGRN